MAEEHVYWVTYYKAAPGKEEVMWALETEIGQPVLDALVKKGVAVSATALKQTAGAGTWNTMLIVELPSWEENGLRRFHLRPCFNWRAEEDSNPRPPDL